MTPEGQLELAAVPDPVEVLDVVEAVVVDNALTVPSAGGDDLAARNLFGEADRIADAGRVGEHPSAVRGDLPRVRALAA